MTYQQIKTFDNMCCKNTTAKKGKMLRAVQMRTDVLTVNVM